MLIVRMLTALSLSVALILFCQVDGVAEYLGGVLLVAKLLGACHVDCLSCSPASLRFASEISATLGTESHILSLICKLDWCFTLHLARSNAHRMICTTLEVERLVLVRNPFHATCLASRTR
jgi:hypothetical protein